MSIRYEDLKKNEKAIVKNPHTGEIERIVNFHDTEIGTEQISKDLTVHGSIDANSASLDQLFISGTISATAFTGSFTSSTDVHAHRYVYVGSEIRTIGGLPYIVPGPGVSIISQSNGQVYVRSTDQAAPNEFPNLLMWFETFSSNNVVLDNSATPPRVTRWNDLSGNDRHLGQATTARMPRWYTSNPLLSGTLGAAPSIELQSAHMLTSSAVSLSTFTIIVGINNKTDGTLIMEHGPNLNTTDGHWIFGGISTGAGAAFNVRRGGLTNAKDMPYGASWAAQNGYPTIWTHQWGGSTSTHRFYLMNTDASLTSNVATNALGTASTSQVLNVGARSGAVLPMSGSLFALVVYSPAISPGSAARVVRYLADRYGVPA